MFVFPPSRDTLPAGDDGIPGHAMFCLSPLPLSGAHQQANLL